LHCATPQMQLTGIDIAIGADFPLSATVSAFAGLSQTAGLSDGNQTRYNVGFSARF
uniref:hypothetical protein n=1 Tax=Salmonella enterica TaxID=28901 RepID=UPI0015C4BF43